MTDNNGDLKPVRFVILEKEPTLEEAQEIVEGWVEMVTLPNGDQMLVNEEGRLKGLPVNPVASQLAGKLLVGNAVLLKGDARWD